MSTVPDILNAPITLSTNIINAPIILGGIPGPAGKDGTGVITVSKIRPTNPKDRNIWIKIK